MASHSHVLLYHGPFTFCHKNWEWRSPSTFITECICLIKETSSKAQLGSIHGATHEVNIWLENNCWRKHIGGFTKCVCLLTIPFETNHTGFEILLNLLCLKKKYISAFMSAVSLMFVALVPSQNLSFTEVTPRRPSFFDRKKTSSSNPAFHPDPSSSSRNS